MTGSHVVDASVAFKWLFEEPLSDAAWRLSTSDVLLFAPKLILTEVANAIWKSVRRGLIDLEGASIQIGNLPNFFNELHDERELIADSLVLATKIDHPVYDCVYLALAQRREAPLVTADERLLAKASGHSFLGQVVPLKSFAA